jgi:hypothetical protein
LYVEVYFYSGKLESDYEDYKFDFVYRLYNIERNKDPETREPNYLYTSLKLLLIFDWLNFFNCRSLSFRDLRLFIDFFRKYNLKAIKRYFKKLYYKKYKVFGLELKSMSKLAKKIRRSIYYQYFRKNINYKYEFYPNKRRLIDKTKADYNKHALAFFEKAFKIF